MTFVAEWIILGVMLVWAALITWRPRGPTPDEDWHRSSGGYGGEYNEWEQK